MTEPNKDTAIGMVGLSVGDAKYLKSAAELESHVTNFKSLGGWTERQSAVCVWGCTQNVVADDPTQGAILSAELFNVQATLTIHFDAGHWVLREIREFKNGEIVFDEWDYVSVRHGLMKYRRYWYDIGKGITPFAYRFVGFA